MAPALDPMLGELNDRFKTGCHQLGVGRRDQHLHRRSRLPDRHDPNRRSQPSIALGLDASSSQLDSVADLAAWAQPRQPERGDHQQFIVHQHSLVLSGRPPVGLDIEQLLASVPNPCPPLLLGVP